MTPCPLLLYRSTERLATEVQKFPQHKYKPSLLLYNLRAIVCNLHSLAGSIVLQGPLGQAPTLPFSFLCHDGQYAAKASMMNPSARLAQSVERETLNLKVAGECKELRKNVSRTK